MSRSVPSSCLLRKRMLFDMPVDFGAINRLRYFVTKFLSFYNVWVVIYFLELTSISSSIKDGEWWEVRKTRDAIFAPFIHSNIYLRTSDFDGSGIHSCYSYKVVEKATIIRHGTFCYPASTSKFYKSGIAFLFCKIFRSHYHRNE